MVLRLMSQMTIILDGVKIDVTDVDTIECHRWC